MNSGWELLKGDLHTASGVADQDRDLTLDTIDSQVFEISRHVC